MIRARLRLFALTVLACTLSAEAALAQLAPPPKKAPRTPVHREVLEGSKSLPLSRLVEGEASILDAERLKVDGVEVRLFGVVPPQLSAPYGPQARNVVDSLAKGSVSCRIRDRDREGHFLASCRGNGDADLGIELLRRGLAVTARGSLRPTELARPYIAAEEAARSQRLGLWSVSPPSAASESSIRELVLKNEAAKEKEKTEARAAETPASSSSPAPDAAKPAAHAEAAPPEALTVVPVSGNEAKTNPVPAQKPEASLHVPMGPTAAEVQAALDAAREEPSIAAETAAPVGFLERYQLLLSSLIALTAALSCIGAFAWFRRQDRREEVRSIAAALRGELMAARAVCLARLSKMAKDRDDKNISWPRIRTLVFQAYVGRLGRLGADLARQVASIYGQASDYASYYVGAEGRAESASKQQSLQTLVQHIEEIMPRLTAVEREGKAPAPSKQGAALASLLGRVVRPASLLAEAREVRPARPAPLPAPEVQSEEPAAVLEEAVSLPETQEPPRKETQQESEVEAEAETEEEKIEKAFNASEEPTEDGEKKREEKGKEAAQKNDPLSFEEKLKVEIKPADKAFFKPQATRLKASAAKKNTKTAPKVETPAAIETKLGKILDSLRELDLGTRLADQASKIKEVAATKWEKLHAKPDEEMIPYYASLTEEEMEALAYADEDYLLSSPPAKRKAG